LRIFIDADGCPVVKNTIKIGIKFGLKLIVVKNHAVHIENKHPDHVDVITVDKSRDSADYYIANRLSPGDLVVTQDYGLAAMVLSKEGQAINQNGMLYSANNIDALLDRRHMNQEMRRKHKKHTSKFKKRTQKDNEDFENKLTEFIKNHIS